jgi:CubicO group peptidase (beta-lactamase class C family)
MIRKNLLRYGWIMPKAAVVGLASVLGSSLPGSAQLSSPGDRVDSIFKQFDKSNSPGCAVAVIKDGNIIYKRGYGMADLDHGIKIAPTTVFHAASLAKQFTAMSIMLLVKGGQLKLDDRVDKFITVPIAHDKHITIRQMLSNISGIRDHWVLVTMAGKHLYDEVVTEANVLNLVSRMTSVDFEPSEGILYSNTGFTLAGQIVQKVTGKSLSDFAHDNIFQPLGMNNTVIIKKHDQAVQNRAFGYTEKPPFKRWMPKLDVTGPTNLQTTVEDLARWDRNFDDKTVGGDAALSPMQTEAKLSNGTTALIGKDDDGNLIHYGLGLMLTKYRGLNVVEHDGRDAGYRAHLIRFPDQHFAVACLCNLALPDDNLPGKLARQVADIYLFSPPAAHSSPAVPPASTPPAPHTPADLAKFTGEYHSKEIDSTYRIVQQGSSLVIKRHNYPDTPLVLASLPARNFRMGQFGRPMTRGLVHFREEAGTIIALEITGFRGLLPRITDFPFTRKP